MINKKIFLHKTWSLTTGVDQGAAFTGTSSDDTFIAVDTSTATTFSALDAINGGAGTDTLNWVNTVTTITAAPAGATITGIEKVNLTSTQNVTLDTTTGWYPSGRTRQYK